MKVLYIGNPISKKQYMDLANKKFISQADNEQQGFFIETLYKKYKENLIVFTPDRIKNRQTIIDSNATVKLFKVNDSSTIRYYVSLMINLSKELLKLMKTLKREKILIITVGPYFYYSFPVLLTKIFYKIKYVVFLICAVEVPEAKGIFKIISKLGKYMIKLADGTITYVAKTSIDYTKKPYLEIQFFVSDKKLSLFGKNEELKQDYSNLILLCFTGSLTKINGIDLMLEVLKKLPNNYKLIVCGDGPLKGEVINFAKKYPNKLQYIGLVTNEKSILFQCNSDILVLFRNTLSKENAYYSKYAVASKYTEYLLTGKPIVSSDGNSINKSIKKYINIVDTEENNIIDATVNKIVEIGSNLKEYNELGTKGKKYLVNYYKSNEQYQKISDFLDTITL